MGEDVVHPAAVDVERRAEIPGAHGRALDMPAGPARPDLGLPDGLALPGRLPEGEVVDALLLVLVGIAAAARAPALQADPGQAAVGGEPVDGEVDRTVLPVGEPLVEQAPDEGRHGADVLGIGRPGVMVGRQDVERPLLGVERLDERTRVVPEAHPPGVGAPDRLVVDVRDVHHVGDLEAGEQEEALEQVLEDIRPPVADMGKVVDRRTAGVEPDLAGLERNELLDPSAEGVVEADHVPLILAARPPLRQPGRHLTGLGGM